MNFGSRRALLMYSAIVCSFLLTILPSPLEAQEERAPQQRLRQSPSDQTSSGQAAVGGRGESSGSLGRAGARQKLADVTMIFSERDSFGGGGQHCRLDYVSALNTNELTGMTISFEQNSVVTLRIKDYGVGAASPNVSFIDSVSVNDVRISQPSVAQLRPGGVISLEIYFSTGPNRPLQSLKSAVERGIDYIILGYGAYERRIFLPTFRQDRLRCIVR